MSSNFSFRIKCVSHLSSHAAAAIDMDLTTMCYACTSINSDSSNKKTVPSIVETSDFGYGKMTIEHQSQ